MASLRSRLAIAGRASRRHRPWLMILRLGLRADGQLQSDVKGFKQVDRVHEVCVVVGFQGNVGADLVSGSARQFSTSISTAPLSLAPAAGLDPGIFENAPPRSACRWA